MLLVMRPLPWNFHGKPLTFLTNRKMVDSRTSLWLRTSLFPRTNWPKNPLWASMHEASLSLFPSKLNSFRVQNQAPELSYPCCQIVRLVTGMVFAWINWNSPRQFPDRHGEYPTILLWRVRELNMDTDHSMFVILSARERSWACLILQRCQLG